MMRPSLLQRLRINRKVSVILLCLFVSIIFWLLIALSKTYPARLRFPLKYTHVPSFKIITNDLPGAIQVSVKTTGFKILSYHFGNRTDSIEFDVASKLAGSANVGKDMVIIPSAVFANDISEQLGNEYLLTGFYPDSIAFSFSSRLSIKLPVRLVSHITFERQYDSTGRVMVMPDSVSVSGPAAVLSAMHGVETETVVLSNVRTAVNEKIKLKVNKLVTFDVNEVNVRIPVEKFTEGITEVPVHVINVPAGYSIKTFPDKVSVHYQVALSLYNRIAPEMFDVVADAGELPDKQTTTLKLSLSTSSEFIRLPSLRPEIVSFILQKQ